MKTTSLFAALSLPLLFACSGAPGSAGSTSDAVTKAAQQGESCGGFVAHPRHCADGLVCINDGDTPDSPGTCHVDTSPAQQGDKCGGSALNARQCADGLACIGADPHRPGSSGTCQAGVGCNDFTTCPTGQVCNATNGGEGLCVDEGSGGGGNTCQTASDCTGLLSHNCRVCDDGSTSCAHWDCNAGACVIATCDAPQPTPCNDFTTCPAGQVCNGGNGGPGICVSAPAGNDCTNAGGSCVALAPGSCDNGQIGDANTYSCGGGLGVMCCLPN